MALVHGPSSAIILQPWSSLRTFPELEEAQRLGKVGKVVTEIRPQFFSQIHRCRRKQSAVCNALNRRHVQVAVRSSSGR